MNEYISKLDVDRRNGKIVDLSKVCRLCVSHLSLVPLFKGDGEKYDLVKKIQRHLSLKVKDVAGMSPHICYKCAWKLMDWDSLVATSLIADARLRHCVTAPISSQENNDDANTATFSSFNYPERVLQVYKKKRKTQNQKSASKSFIPDVEHLKVLEKNLPDTKLVTCVEEITYSFAGGSVYSEIDTYEETNNYLPIKTEKLDAPESVSVHDEAVWSNNLTNVNNVGSQETDEKPAFNKIDIGVKQELEEIGLYNDPNMPLVCVREEIIDYKENADQPNIEETRTKRTQFFKSGKTYTEEQLKILAQYFAHRDKRRAKTATFSGSKSLVDASKFRPENSDQPNNENISCTNKSQSYKTVEIYTEKLMKKRAEWIAYRDKRRAKRKSKAKQKKVLQEFVCETCHEVFNYKTRLLKHQKSVHRIPVPSFTCETCGKTCLGRDRFKKHLETHVPASTLCFACGKVFSKQYNLVTHIRIAHGDRKDERSFICPVPNCGKTFRYNGTLQHHVRVHAGERNVSCATCGKLFFHKNTLRQHMISHTTGRPYACDKCKCSYNRIGNLTSHKKTHEPGYVPNIKKHVPKIKNTPGKPYACDKCSLSFIRHGNLIKHKMTHEDGFLSNKQSLQCSSCDKQLRTKTSLIRHIAKIHTGEVAPYACDTCGERFKAPHSLEVHERVHTGERPFPCTECDKTFRSRACLNQHVLLHGDVFPHSCPFCDRGFKRFQSFLIHKRTHSDERNHKCSVCSRAFREKSDMKKHQRKHEK